MSSGSRTLLTVLGGYGALMALAGTALASSLTTDPTQGSESASVTAVVQNADEEPRLVNRANLGERPPADSANPGDPDAPGEQAPAAESVSGFTPTSMVLPSGTTAPVQSVGVEADGNLVIPPNPAVVGYWNGGARAGADQGSMVIAGHVDSREYGLGVLYQLKGVRPGAVISISGQGARREYVVTATRMVNQQSLATDDSYFRQDVPHQLVLITCGGPFDPVKRSYRDNYIVLARPA